MLELFESKIDKLFKQIKKREYFEFNDPAFYARLESDLSDADKWSNTQKSGFILATIRSFEGGTGISAENCQNIYGLSKSPETIKCLELIASRLSGVSETRILKLILKEVKRIQHRQQHPIYDLNQKPSVIIQDPGLKLAVINQLMFRENKLHPKFDIHLFAEEYKEHCIDLDYNGASYYAMEYLLNLDIPQPLLNQIETLYLDSGICLPSIMHYMVTFRGLDGYLPLTEKAMEDLKILPNLKEVRIIGDKESTSFINNSLSTNSTVFPVKKQFEIMLKEYGISLITESKTA